MKFLIFLIDCLFISLDIVISILQQDLINQYLGRFEVDLCWFLFSWEWLIFLALYMVNNLRLYPVRWEWYVGLWILLCCSEKSWCTIVLISHTSKVMLKILQARLQQYVNCELQMFKLVLEKAEEPEINLPTSVGSSKKQESWRKTSIFALLTSPKPLTVWITINWKFLKRWEYQTTWPAFWEICMQVKKQQLELDME